MKAGPMAAVMAVALVSVAAGAAMYAGLTQSPVVEKNVTEVVGVEQIDRYWFERDGYVQAVIVGNETVHMESHGMTEADPTPDGPHVKERLYVILSSDGGDVRATFEPWTCPEDDCGFRLETAPGGASNERQVVSPAGNWNVTVEAAETTSNEIWWHMLWVWSSSSYDEEPADDYAREHRDGVDDDG